jgi:hypothetical protein
VAGSKEALEKASEIDMTGAAMAALCTAGVANTSESIANARKYLASKFVKASGAFESAFGANTDSNAWAVQGLKACGIDPQAAEFTGSAPKLSTPLNFLISQQLGGGGFRYGTSGSTAEPYASQDAVRALGSGGFTATPPVPAKGPQWKGVTEFAPGEAETNSLALIVDNGSSPLKICSVSLTPKATTTTLATVLNAAVVGTTPASCVASFLPASSEGAITQINGYPLSPAEKWNVSIDGGVKAQAKRNTTIKVGDTIYRIGPGFGASDIHPTQVWSKSDAAIGPVLQKSPGRPVFSPLGHGAFQEARRKRRAGGEVKVGIGSDDVAPLKARVPCLAGVGLQVEEVGLDRARDDPRLVKLLAAGDRPGGTKRGVEPGAHRHVVNREMRRIHRCLEGQDTAHLVAAAVVGDEALAEVEKASALRVDRHPLRGQSANLSGKRAIRRQVGGEALRVAAAEVYGAGAGGKRGIADRREREQLESGLGQETQIVLVVEAEGLVASDREACSGPSSRLGGLVHLTRRVCVGECLEAREVDSAGRPRLSRPPLPRGLLVLGRGQQPEMPFGNQQRIRAGDRSEDERPQLLRQGAFDHLPVGVAADAVEDETRDPYCRVEVPHPKHHRAGGARHPPDVEDEQDRHPQQLCGLSRAVAPTTIRTVVESAHRLDYRDVGALRPMLEGMPHALGAHHPGVEVDGVSARRLGEVGRVDEIGPELEGLDPQTRFA